MTRTKINLGTVGKPIKLDLETCLYKMEQDMRYTRGSSDIHVLTSLGNARRLLTHYHVKEFSQEEARRLWRDMEARGLSRNTIRHYMLAYEEMARANGVPLKVDKPVRERRPADFLSAPEVRALIDSAGNVRDRAILSVLAYCGVRNGELCRLDTGDIDWINRMMIIRKAKNKRPRQVVIKRECMAALEAWIKIRPDLKTTALFMNKYGARLTKDRLCIIVREAGRRAGIERRVHPHMLRHTCGTRMIGTGMSTRDTADQLGFSSLAMLDVYVHNDSRELREKIDKMFYY
ncbi:tyrosine-type recombinase/integrase [Methanocella sp. MCL-LM]|uniref:tyrosine-type recombinase/integrase n=1 Tax=Methanocella sp. MCL-LM TaxID=3412035 RepID=UPI003C72C98E